MRRSSAKRARRECQDHLAALILTPRTSILKPQTSILKPQTSILKLQTSILKPQTSILKRPISVFSPKTMISNAALVGQVAASQRLAAKPFTPYSSLPYTCRQNPLFLFSLLPDMMLYEINVNKLPKCETSFTGQNKTSKSKHSRCFHVYT